jgi:hypothetical protein
MRVPQEYTSKVDKIKNIILSRSGLISEYGMNNVKIEVDEFYESETEGVTDLVFSITLTDIYCDECDFEPKNIGNIILELKDKIEKASNFYMSENLDLKSSSTSLRGVLFYESKIWRDTFENLTFGIFYDPGKTY